MCKSSWFGITSRNNDTPFSSIPWAKPAANLFSHTVGSCRINECLSSQLFNSLKLWTSCLMARFTLKGATSILPSETQSTWSLKWTHSYPITQYKVETISEGTQPDTLDRIKAKWGLWAIYRDTKTAQGSLLSPKRIFLTFISRIRITTSTLEYCLNRRTIWCGAQFKWFLIKIESWNEKLINTIPLSKSTGKKSSKIEFNIYCHNSSVQRYFT